MKVLVDTSVWSLALRRRQLTEAHPNVLALQGLLGEGRAALIGPIRQEVLSGIRDPAVFEAIRKRLRAFPDEALEIEDFEHAAHCSNVCRHKGISGGHIDFLICAVAARRQLEILTSDEDFSRYAKHLPIRLHRGARS